jgi:hypothetical protein
MFAAASFGDLPCISQYVTAGFERPFSLAEPQDKSPQHRLPKQIYNNIPTVLPI